MDECSQWKFWGRKRFCEELLKAVPDISVARPESSANFVELIAQVVIRFDLADPSVEESVDQSIQAIVHRFPDATPAQHLRAVKILTSRLPELPINWRIILYRLIKGAEVNLTKVNGFRVTWLAQLDRARLAKEPAEEYWFEVNFTSNTRLNMTNRSRKRRLLTRSLRHRRSQLPAWYARGVGTPTMWWTPVDFDRAMFSTRTPIHTRGRTHIRSF
jgi:hypothetical protein